MENNNEPPNDHQSRPENKGTETLSRGDEHPNQNTCDPKGNTKEEKITVFKIAEFILLILVFLATATAACYTKKQWETAADQEHRSLRAYVLYSGGDISVTRAQIKLKNMGQTPAYNITSWMNVRAMDKTDNPIRDLRNEETDLAPSMDIGGQAPDYPIEHPILLDDLKAMRAGKVLYVWGIVKYRDAFQRCQVTAFRAQANHETAPGVWDLKMLDHFASNDCPCNNKAANPRATYMANDGSPGTCAP